LPAAADAGQLKGHSSHKLAGDRKGQYSIRVNDQYRVCFRWEGGEAVNVELVDYH
jgi:toxin HigB-1